MNAASWLEGLPASERARALLLRDGPRIATWALAIAIGVQAALILTDLAEPARRAAARARARRGGARQCAPLRHGAGGATRWRRRAADEHAPRAHGNHRRQ